MEALKIYFIPVLISNLVLGLTILGALKKPLWTRFLLAGLFLWASYFNATTAIKTPESYLDYANLNALPLYKNFINGFFSKHITLFILIMATGQFLIFLGLILHKTLTKLSCIGGIVFGLAVAPLGVGSAFPSTIFMAITFYILLKRYDHDYIWKLTQYKHKLKQIKSNT